MNLKLFQRFCAFSLFAEICLQSHVALADQYAKIGEGLPVSLEQTDVTISPPKGWEYRAPDRGKAMVMQAPVGPTVYGKVTYRRNITLALVQEPRPIDASEIATLSNKLQVDFGQAAGVSEFQILEQRLTDYRAKSDAILVYASFLYLGTPMTQMNLFVSGAERSALVTYTDLSENFQKNDDAMAQAWNAMISVDMKGASPQRYQAFYPLIVGFGLSIVGLLCLFLLRRRLAKRLIMQAESGMYQDEDAWEADPRSDLLTAANQSFISDVVPSGAWSRATAYGSKDRFVKRSRGNLKLHSTGY